MKQLLVLSGKGGTGKTTVASALVKLSAAKAYADCDVDAPNLHLVMGWETQPRRTDYYGLPKAKIHPELCAECGECRAHCRFDAISLGEGYRVDPFACEGCGVCAEVCPAGAITMEPAVAGEYQLYKGDAVFSTAQLRMGSGNSGMLVSEVKKQMKEEAPEADLAIIDGSPGIGCPVIASLSGVDMVLLVAEPSVSGISDLERVLATARKFQVPAAVCVNKYDTDLDNTGRIEAFCRKEEIPFVGLIPFDPEAVRAINRGASIVDADCPSGQAVRGIREKTLELLYKEG
ncbi:ATP-binding protein [Anaerotalea alkaliphila]|uniref:ATPase n=1 Tax=Anaerotalea alkaliphila TaxID=2662126 RepID=A0A7X5HY69_9FIRM|nr:ATP-binding protein [Anaerotalea alkaliphila]NDL68805.1 ATPase [Anaerotalea alkaliphila]